MHEARVRVSHYLYTQKSRLAFVIFSIVARPPLVSKRPNTHKLGFSKSVDLYER
ncbi:hypothetical protein CERSUDRAFT_118526 [Gelatoporia subvermispora B]|uniref:Uncharacterized protein n=1 Tax=Ceriporiopsis subvermispora (strain B) TaxID=914234 RepID=M2R3N7_CERS8|nr:hypothetical protein CERSUDRAFT_118526 [Gelatoporia subvermispora B]